jgi:hypothetical protein
MTRRLTAVLLLLVSTGCSRKKTLTSDDLKSQLTRTISFAFEEEMFVDYLHAGRATSNFASSTQSRVARGSDFQPAICLATSTMQWGASLSTVRIPASFFAISFGLLPELSKIIAESAASKNHGNCSSDLR